MLKRHGKLLRYSKDIQTPDGDGKSLFFFFGGEGGVHGGGRNSRNNNLKKEKKKQNSKGTSSRSVIQEPAVQL